MFYLDAGTRALLLVVFLFAASSKVASRKVYEAFADSLNGFSWLPRRMRGLIPPGVIAVEAAAVASLAVPGFVTLGFVLTAGMMLALSGAVAWSLHRGDQIRCLCFGSDAGPMGVAQLVRNVLLAGAAAVGLWAHVAARGTVPVAGVGVSAAVGIGVGLSIVRWDNLVSVLRRVRKRTDVPPPRTTPPLRLPAVGTRVGAFQISDADGAVLTEADLAQDVRHVGFLLVGCRPCKEQIAAMRASDRHDPARTILFVVADDPSTQYAAALVESVRDLGRVALMSRRNPVAPAVDGIGGYPTLLRVESGTVAAAGSRWTQITDSPIAEVSASV